MALDLSKLQASIDALNTQVKDTQGEEQSAKVLIDGIGKRISDAVTAALENDAAANASSIVAAQQAIDSVTAVLKASGGDLAASIAANGDTSAGTPSVPTGTSTSATT